MTEKTNTIIQMMRKLLDRILGRRRCVFQRNALCGDQLMSDEQIAAALGNRRETQQIRAVAQLLAYEYSACAAIASDPETAAKCGELAHATGGMRAIENVIAQLNAATESREGE